MTNFKKYLIVINEKAKDRKIANKFIIEKFKSSDCIILFKPKIETAPRVGIDIKKDILAESNLLKFKIRAAVIVIPDLLTPGIKEKI